MISKKLTSFAAMALIGSMGFAAAQTATPPQTPSPRGITPPTSAQVSADTAGGSIASGGSLKSAAATGWNFFHIKFCYAFYSGSTFYLYLYPTEGGYWYTTDSHFQGLLYPACGTGNWAGVYVTNTSGTWNYAEVYDYK
jgi:hypothetical protein